MQPEEAQEKNIGIVVVLPPGCLRPKQRGERRKTKHMTILYMCLWVWDDLLKIMWPDTYYKTSEVCYISAGQLHSCIKAEVIEQANKKKKNSGGDPSWSLFLRKYFRCNETESDMNIYSRSFLARRMLITRSPINVKTANTGIRNWGEVSAETVEIKKQNKLPRCTSTKPITIKWKLFEEVDFCRQKKFKQEYPFLFSALICLPEESTASSSAQAFSTWHFNPK